MHISLQGSRFDDVKDAFRIIPEVSDILLDSSEAGTIGFHLACDGTKDIRPELYDIIKNNNWLLLEFRRESRTLETIFRELTREG
jgi:hypothetical protein